MTNGNTMTKRLLAKELRQLIPLMATLLGVGVTLIILWSVLFAGNRSVATEGIALLLPALFAAGASAVLVGQEKEQGTLLWLNSLPGSPPQLIGMKLLSGCIGLLVMWAVCWALIGVLSLSSTAAGGSSSGSALESLLSDVLYLHVHSVFVLLCGFYTAWRINNTFTSILAIVPLASIPFAVLQLGYAFREQWLGYRYIEPGPGGIASYAVTLSSMLVIGLLGYRAARRYLDPTPAPRLTGSATRWVDAWRPVGGAPTQTTPFRFSISSLVWQAVHHNHLALLGMLTMILAGCVGLLIFATLEPPNADASAFLCLLAVALGISFLGVFVFAGDGSDRKLRFLAERGVSPSRVWLGRQSVGIAVLSALLTLYTFVVPAIPDVGQGISSYLPSTGLVSLTALALYSVSQWTGQVIRSLAASAFLAPVLSVLAAWWLGFSALELDTPFWLILVTSLIPLVATWSLMSRFMEGTRRGLIYVTAAATVVLVLSLPAVPVAIELSRLPGMPAEYRNEFSASARQDTEVSDTRRPQAIALIPFSEDDFDRDSQRSPEETLVILERQGNRPQDILSLPSSTDGPWSIDPHVFERAIQAASYVKLQFLTDPQDENAIASLGEWIRALTQTASRVRASDRWHDQEAADQIEIWLTQTLAEPPLAALADRDFCRESLILLADSASRTRARRRSIVASWRQTLDGEAPPLLNNLASSAGSLGTTRMLLLRRRKMEGIVGVALKMLDVGRSNESTEPMRHQLHQLVVGSGVAFDDGPYAARLRVSATQTPALSLYRMSIFPATQWFAPWEEDAKRLAGKHLDGQPNDPAEMQGDSQ